MEIDYELKKHKKTLTTNEFYDTFFDFELVQGFCMECPRYDTNYSCSPLEINIKEFVSSYDYIDIYVTQLFFNEEDYEREYTKESFNDFLNDSYYKERDKIQEKVKNMEQDYPKAFSLTGPCNHCASNCKELYDECIHPEIRRYSLASLGFDSRKILKDLFNIELLLIEGKLPRYMNNITSILYSEK